jgi:hypothetical protein
MTLTTLPALVGAAMVSLLSGCGAAGTSDADGASKDKQGLECVSNCDEGVFFRGGLFPVNFVDLPGGHMMAPALCSSPSNGFVAISVDEYNEYRVLEFNGDANYSNWDIYDTDANNNAYTWNSKPACALTDSNTFNGEPGFMVVGKGSDNTLHNADGQMAPSGNPQSTNAEQIEVDEQISSTTYSAGSPGVASSQDSSGNGLVVVAIIDDQRTLNIYTKPFPVLWTYWSSVFKGPKLPAGWTAIGAPAIASEPNNKWAVVVHARNGSTDAIFRTIVTAPYNKNPTFSLLWTRLGGSLNVEIDDDPALTWDSTLSTETLFIRSGNATIYQTSGPLGTHPLDPIALESWDWIQSGPAAAVGGFDQGDYVVLARGWDNNLYNAESINEGDLQP